MTTNKRMMSFSDPSLLAHMTVTKLDKYAKKQLARKLAFGSMPLSMFGDNGEPNDSVLECVLCQVLSYCTQECDETGMPVVKGGDDAERS